MRSRIIRCSNGTKSNLIDLLIRSCAESRCRCAADEARQSAFEISNRTMTLWGGRFTENQNQLAAEFNNSLPFDWRLAAVDVRGSIAWALALARANVITALEAEQLVAGLNTIQDEIEAGRLDFNTGEEDIHTLIERRLGEIVGAVAGKLHTGRSRNDQVATDFRLWMLDAIAQIDAAGEESADGADQARRAGSGMERAAARLHALPARAADLAESLVAVALLAVAARSRTVEAVARSDGGESAGRGRVGGHGLPDRSGGVGARSRFRQRRAEQPRCGVRSRLRRRVSVRGRA